MKNSFLFNYTTILKRLKGMRILAVASIVLLSFQLEQLYAQNNSRLSVQGILKKANGEAVEDNVYELKFKLWTAETGGTMVWQEDQDNVEVIGGIYSTVLGNITPLSIPFNQIYYLGVTIGTTEMKPRVQLTSAPYALALIGASNQFPSSGIVIADSIRVNGGVLARGGVPGLNGASKNGFAFTGANGDKDSGLFSITEGQVSMYVNNAPLLTATPDSVAIRKDLRFKNEGNINYNGLDDWRLVETDYFETDEESWKRYSTWNNGSGTAATVTSFTDDFAGKAVVNTAGNQVLKKKFTLPGSSVTGTYTYVKVVFKYFYLDSWDFAGSEKGWAAFSKTESCTELSVGWLDERAWAGYGVDGTGAGGAFNQAANFSGATGNNAYSDQWILEEMVGRYPSGASNTDFWVIFGGTSDGGPGDENFGVGMIEIWVK